MTSLDGTTIDLPDTPDLGGALRPPWGLARRQRLSPAAPADADRSKRRFDGTHAIFAIACDRYHASEVELAPELLRRLEPGMLCLADRAFVGFALWQRTTATGADLLWRVRQNQILPCSERLPDGSYLSRLYASPKHRRHDTGGATVRVIDYRLEGVPDAEPLYRLVTTLLEPTAAPAAELAALYHERWASDRTFAELKVSLPGQRLLLRSRRADLAEQELYGLLLAHFALRRLIHDASRHAGCDPDTLSFLHTVRIVRRHLPFHAAFPPRRRHRMVELILIEITALPAERSRGRHNPRVVKRKMSSFPTIGLRPIPRRDVSAADRSRAAAAPQQVLRYHEHIRIVAPPGPPEPSVAPLRGTPRQGLRNPDQLRPCRSSRRASADTVRQIKSRLLHMTTATRPSPVGLWTALRPAHNPTGPTTAANSCAPHGGQVNALATLPGSGLASMSIHKYHLHSSVQ